MAHALGETAPPAPRNADLPRCTHCGAPLVPSAQPSQPCGACGVLNDMPQEIRERVAAQQHMEAARDAKAASIQLLLAQPHPARSLPRQQPLPPHHRPGTPLPWCLIFPKAKTRFRSDEPILALAVGL